MVSKLLLVMPFLLRLSPSPVPHNKNLNYLDIFPDYFSRSGYFQACDELQIFCSTCSPAQLAALKLARVLPISAAQCGLITKSDAERLCSLLVSEPGSRERHSSGSPPESAAPPVSPAPSAAAPSSPSGGGAVSPPRGDPTSFKVQHECFGDCVGVIHPQSYSSQGAKCIGKILALSSFIPVILKAKCNPLKPTPQLWTLATAARRLYSDPNKISFCCQSVLSVRAGCPQPSSCATRTASRRTEPVTGGSTPRTGQLISRSVTRRETRYNERYFQKL